VHREIHVTNEALVAMAATDDNFPTITEEGVEALRAMIGQPIRSDRPYVTELNADAIRHWAYGIGDRNPLWCDEEYARAGGRPHVAPPTILLAMDKVLSGYVTGLPGIHAMWAGADFSFRRAPVAGDRLTASSTLKALIERPSRFAGRSFQQVYEVTFTDQAGDVVATAESYCFRTERDTARELGKYQSTRVQWSPQQIAEIAERYRAEAARRRGAEVRYIGDVATGDPLPPITKGPYTATTAIAFLLGWGGLYVRAHGDAYDLFDIHPALGIPNEWGVPEPPERVHWDPDLARRVGVPGAYDYGPERCSWMGHVVTDWMGDDGFLEHLSVQVRRHNVLGELVTCQGRVTEVDDSSGRARLLLSATNQDGLESARGTATVVLPQQ
jgi:acyl dehydratase